MPLNLAEFGSLYEIHKVCGDEKERHYLESLGFTVGTRVRVLSEIHGYFIVQILESRIGIEKQMAQNVILVA